MVGDFHVHCIQHKQQFISIHIIVYGILCRSIYIIIQCMLKHQINNPLSVISTPRSRTWQNNIVKCRCNVLKYQADNSLYVIIISVVWGRNWPEVWWIWSHFHSQYQCRGRGGQGRHGSVCFAGGTELFGGQLHEVPGYRCPGWEVSHTIGHRYGKSFVENNDVSFSFQCMCI